VSNILSSGRIIISDAQAAANLKRYQISKGRQAKAVVKAAKVDTKPVDKVAITVKRYGADSLAAQLAVKGVFL